MTDVSLHTPANVPDPEFSTKEQAAAYNKTAQTDDQVNLSEFLSEKEFFERQKKQYGMKYPLEPNKFTPVEENKSTPLAPKTKLTSTEEFFEISDFDTGVKYAQELYNRITYKRTGDQSYINRLKRLKNTCEQNIRFLVQFPKPSEQLPRTGRFGVRTVRETINVYIAHDTEVFRRDKKDITNDIDKSKKHTIRMLRCNAIIAFTMEPCRININSNDVENDHGEILFILASDAQAGARFIARTVTLLYAAKVGPIYSEVPIYWNNTFKQLKFVPVKFPNVFPSEPQLSFWKGDNFDRTSVNLEQLNPQNGELADELKYPQDEGSSDLPTLPKPTIEPIASAYVNGEEQSQFISDFETIQRVVQDHADSGIIPVLTARELRKIHTNMAQYVLSTQQDKDAIMLALLAGKDIDIPNPKQDNLKLLAITENMLQEIGIDVSPSVKTTYADMSSSDSLDVIKSNLFSLRALTDAEPDLASEQIALEKRLAAAGKFITEKEKAESASFIWRNISQTTDFDVQLVNGILQPTPSFADVSQLHSRLQRLRIVWSEKRDRIARRLLRDYEKISQNPSDASIVAQPVAAREDINSLATTATRMEQAFQIIVGQQTFATHRVELQKWYIESREAQTQNMSAWPDNMTTTPSTSLSASTITTQNQQPSRILSMLMMQQSGGGGRGGGGGTVGSSIIVPLAPVPSRAQIDDAVNKFEQQVAMFATDEEKKRTELRTKIRETFGAASVKKDRIQEIATRMNELGQLQESRASLNSANECFQSAASFMLDAQDPRPDGTKNSRTSAELQSSLDVLISNNACLDRYVAMFELARQRAVEQVGSVQDQDVQRSAVEIRRLADMALVAIQEARTAVNQPSFLQTNTFTHQLTELETKAAGMRANADGLVARLRAVPDRVKRAKDEETKSQTQLKEIVQICLGLSKQDPNSLQNILLTKQLTMGQAALDQARRDAITSAKLAQTRLDIAQQKLYLTQAAQQQTLKQVQFETNPFRTLQYGRDDIDQRERQTLISQRTTLDNLVNDINTRVADPNMSFDDILSRILQAETTAGDLEQKSREGAPSVDKDVGKSLTEHLRASREALAKTRKTLSMRKIKDTELIVQLLSRLDAQIKSKSRLDVTVIKSLLERLAIVENRGGAHGDSALERRIMRLTRAANLILDQVAAQEEEEDEGDEEDENEGDDDSEADV